MKKGINIWSFDDSKTFYEKVDIAKKAGFDGIELSLDMTGEVSLESTEKDLKEVKKNIEDKVAEIIISNYPKKTSGISISIVDRNIIINHI